MRTMAPGPSLVMLVALAAWGCSSGAPRPGDGGLSGEAGAAPASCGGNTCPATAVCVCPAGARSCTTGAACATVCPTASDGSHTCPTGGPCVVKGVACCEGIVNCALTCLDDYVCAQ